MKDYARIERVIHYLDTHYQEQPDLRTLARVAQLSEFHFHRLFTKWAGITPKTFIQHLTAGHAKRLLRRSHSILEASLESGLSGPSRLHDLLVSVEGVTPGEFKSGGQGLNIGYGFHETPFGTCFIALTPRGICALEFLKREDAGARQTTLTAFKRLWKKAVIRHDPRSTQKMMAQIFDRTSKNRRKFPVLMAGTPFQIKVWNALLKIPSGKVLSYGDMAKLIGHPRASRAVGTALAANPICYLIPCHRVIQSTGAIGNYGGGPLRKKSMLAWEMAGTVTQ